MKRVIDIFLILLIFFVIYFLQSNFFIWFNIAGIKPNLFLILTIIIGIFLQKEFGFIFGTVFGLIIDFILGIRIGLYAFAFGIIGFGSGIIGKNFSKDNKLTLIIIVTILTLIAESIFYGLGIAIIGNSFNLLKFITIIFIEIIYNNILVIIFYPLIIKFGSKLKNDFNNQKRFPDYLY